MILTLHEPGLEIRLWGHGSGWSYNIESSAVFNVLEGLDRRGSGARDQPKLEILTLTRGFDPPLKHLPLQFAVSLVIFALLFVDRLVLE